MSTSTTSDFNKAANQKRRKPKRKRPAPLSIRLTEDERQQLSQRAGNKPIGTYVKRELFGKESVRKSPVRRKNIDYQLFGRLLAALGESELATYLCILAAAAEQGRLQVDEDMTGKLNTACADIRAMRLLLMTALDMKPRIEP